MKKRAFNLVEVVLAVALLGIMSFGLFMLLKAPIDASVSSQKEFEVQSSMRLATESVDKNLKNATAAFLLTKKDNKFKNEWNYFIVDEKDGNARIVLHEWTGSGFVTKVLAEAPKDEVKYTITFKKAAKSGLLNFRVLATDLKRNKEYDITSDIKVLNTNTVVDQSKMDYSLSPPEKAGNCLAFRSDIPNPNLEGSGYHHVLVSFILDTSGSMSWTLGGRDDKVGSPRIAILKEELNKFFKNLVDQDKAGVIDVRVYPFSTKCFESNSQFSPGAPQYGTFLNIKEKIKTDSNFFKKLVASINNGGGTNVGDAVRFAYDGFKEYEKEKRKGPDGKNKRIKHFLFVLTDGVPTFSSVIPIDYKYEMKSGGLELVVQNQDELNKFTGIKDDKTHRVINRDEMFSKIINRTASGLSILDTCYMEAHFIYGFRLDEKGKKLYVDPLIKYQGHGNSVDDGTWVDNSTKKEYQLYDEIYNGELGIIDGRIRGRLFDSPGYKGEYFYVKNMSDFVKNYRSQNPKEPVDVTVVGFSSVKSDNEYCNKIGQDIGAKPGADGRFFKECNSPGALQAAFDAFSEAVVASSLWYIAGPE